MATRTVEERLASIEATFATRDALAKVEGRLASIEATLPHLATKADVERLMWRLGGLIVVCVGIGVAVLRLWQ